MRKIWAEDAVCNITSNYIYRANLISEAKNANGGD
jgi:hypothetical protein